MFTYLVPVFAAVVCSGITHISAATVPQAGPVALAVDYKAEAAILNAKTGKTEAGGVQGEQPMMMRRQQLKAATEGVCHGKPTCGGLMGGTCPEGDACMDDPDDHCDPRMGGYGCNGCCVHDACENHACPSGKKCELDREGNAVCVQDHGAMVQESSHGNNSKGKTEGVCHGKDSCAGMMGGSCPSGDACIDDPDDHCDPRMGGFGCNGCCVHDECKNHACPSGKKCELDREGNAMCIQDHGAMVQESSHGNTSKGKTEGVCHGKDSCAGMMGGSCPSGDACIDDPDDHCDPRMGGFGCNGCCVPDQCLAQHCEQGKKCKLDRHGSPVCV